MKASLHILASFFVDKYYCQLHGLPWWLSGKESARQEMWVQPLSQEDPLEKKMATNFSTHAWEIPWTEEPGGLKTPGGVTRSCT